MDGYEIYIPEIAEVKNIKLGDLPKTTLRKIKSHPSINGSPYGKDLASFMAVWISPVAVREQSNSSTNQPVVASNNCIALLAGIERKAVKAPFPMSVVSSSVTAFNFLTHVFSSKCTEETRTPTKSPNLPFGLPPHHQHDAIIIFCGRVYLSVKRPILSKNKRGSRINCLDSPTPNPSFQHLPDSEQLSLTSDAPGIQTMASPPSPESTAERSLTGRASLHRFGINRRLLVSLTKISPLYMKGLLAERQQGESRTEALCIEEGSQEENEKIQVRDERVRSHSPVVEQNGGLEETQDSFVTIQTTASERGVDQPGRGSDESSSDDAERTAGSRPARGVAMDVDEPGSSGDVSAPGTVGAEGGRRGWTSNLPVVPALGRGQGEEEDYDFELLAHEEAISRLKAQLREREAALSDVRGDEGVTE